MDISQINYIGKQLNWVEELPCCRSTSHPGSEHFDPTPSSLTYAQLVDELPCLRFTDPNHSEPLPSRHNSWNVKANYDRFRNSHQLRPQQKYALDAFRIIHTEVCRNLGPAGIRIADLRQIAVSFDNFFFGGKLLEHCAIEWWNNPPETHAGEAQWGYSCAKHGQVFTMRIFLKRQPEERNRRRQIERLTSILALLLHELCHVWVGIFGDWRNKGILDVLQEFGPTGHGLAWENTMKMCYWAALDYFELDIDVLIHCEDDGNRDGDSAYTMVQLDDWLQNEKHPEHAPWDIISARLSVSTEYAKNYAVLREKGFSSLEAITLIWGAYLVPWLKPEMEHLIPEGWKYRND